MRIHSDTITAGDIGQAVADEVLAARFTISEHGSRKRARAFELSLCAAPGKDRHGITRRYGTGGSYGQADGVHRACTWVEWGYVIARLFKADPAAIVGPYEGADDFVRKTTTAARQRDKQAVRMDGSGGTAFMDCERHADSWSDSIFGVAA